MREYTLRWCINVWSHGFMMAHIISCPGHHYEQKYVVTLAKLNVFSDEFEVSMDLFFKYWTHEEKSALFHLKLIKVFLQHMSPLQRHIYLYKWFIYELYFNKLNHHGFFKIMALYIDNLYISLVLKSWHQFPWLDKTENVLMMCFSPRPKMK